MCSVRYQGYSYINDIFVNRIGNRYESMWNTVLIEIVCRCLYYRLAFYYIGIYGITADSWLCKYTFGLPFRRITGYVPFNIPTLLYMHVGLGTRNSHRNKTVSNHCESSSVSDRSRGGARIVRSRLVIS